MYATECLSEFCHCFALKKIFSTFRKALLEDKSGNTLVSIKNVAHHTN